MTAITILDPSVGTQNVGDEIIHDAVTTQLSRIFPDAFFMRVSSHEFMLWESRKILSKSKYIFVGGSNLLKSKMEWNTQWKLSIWDLFSLRNTILLGCGWRHYDSNMTPYTKALYRRVLSGKFSHSVRDQFSANQLVNGGIGNVSNTACVTMWDLDRDHCASIPKVKSRDAVVTVTAYHPDPKMDREFLELALNNYGLVHLFPQQPEDIEYGQSLVGGRLNVIQPTLKEYDKLLRSDVDYIGTRLHGGIRALQHGRRTLIVGIDNRATEISRDTNLPVMQRDQVSGLSEWINSPQEIVITRPVSAIESWKSQFSTTIEHK